MKTYVLSLLIVLLSASSAFAQSSVVPKHFGKTKYSRNEIVIPNVNGYNIYKADLHTHTFHSDGDVSPALRVEEAWRDGLDIVAITDHMEYRRIERQMYPFMKGYIREDLQAEGKAVNTNVLNKAPDSYGVLPDFNIGYEKGAERGAKLGIMVIKGVEITRGNEGDYNALFTTDNNKIYDPNLEKTIRNAREQGAFIFHNHPFKFSSQYAKKQPTHCAYLYNGGLIDGMELANGFYMWNNLIDYCFNNNYTPIATSDVHDLITTRFPGAGREYFRNMTLILSKKCDNKSIKAALLAKRTIAYCSNVLIGNEYLLSELFKACVEIETIAVGQHSKRVLITNRSSLPYSFRWESGKESFVAGLSATVIEVDKGCKHLGLEVTNMKCGTRKSPVVLFKLK